MNNRLRELRIKRKWTQSNIADWLRVSSKEIQSIERNRSIPSLRLANRIADLFEVPVQLIFDQKTE